MPRFARACKCFVLSLSAVILLVSQLPQFAASDDAKSKTSAKASAESHHHKAAEPADYRRDLPRIPGKSPAEAMKTFQVHPGFRLEQVATEPLVRDPVAMEFDENGRLFVVEMIDYSEQDKDFLGEIRMLEDTNGDGKFDKAITFADKLSWPTALHCYDGGVFVGAAPHIYYLKDTNGDGKADVRQLVYTGFKRDNVQGMLNSFRWGLDNRIHGATGTSGGVITRPDVKPPKELFLQGRDFAFDPKTREMTATSGGAQHGMCFDDWGNKFACSNSDHIQLIMFEDRYIARNPYLAAPSSRISIAADGPQAEVFRISPVEPWRIIRTRLRVQGQVQGSIEGGGRAAGYFTGATGTTIYRGNAFPAEYHGQAFVGDVGSNIVHRKTVKPNGLGFIADRADVGREFVASTDTWFRPAQFANAPDGTLYIADVYREVIEHPFSIPPEIKKHLDLTSGRDKGRIYRVLPDGFKQPALPKLGSAKSSELVELLDHPNAWHRETAARLLFTRQDKSVVPQLEQLVNRGSPLGRMHALYALQGLHSLTPKVVVQATADGSPEVRRHAIKLCEGLISTSDYVAGRLCLMYGEEDPRVRYQLAFSLGDVTHKERLKPLVEILKRDSKNHWTRLAVQSSLVRDADAVFILLAGNPEYREKPEGQEVLLQLSRQIGLQSQPDAVTRSLAGIEALAGQDRPLAARLIGRMAEGFVRNRSPLLGKLSGKPAELLQDSISEARQLAQKPDTPLKQRIEAIQVLKLGKFTDLQELFVELLQQTQPREVQSAALDALSEFDNPEIASIIVDAWGGFSPFLRRRATEALLYRPSWTVTFLTAFEEDKLPRGDFERGRLPQLRTHADPQVRAKGALLEKKFQIGSRNDVLKAYQGALTLKGDVTRGRNAFRRTCVVCHRLEGVGYEIGPSLATIKTRGADAILLNLLDPNREVNPQFVNYLVTTKAGKTFTGLIAGETATSVTLKRAENQTDTILRLDIDEMRSSGVSLMPEGLEKDLDKQGVADLIAYLLQTN